MGILDYGNWKVRIKMQIVVDIPEELYKATVNGLDANEIWDLRQAIADGVSLPKGHGKLKDVDKFLEKVKKDREHEIYLHSWTADMVLERLDSWYAPIIIEADKESYNDGWCNTCEYKHLESKCVGCAKYDEYDNLISLSKYKKSEDE